MSRLCQYFSSSILLVYMTKYVALLRGIGPGNPNMRNEKLRAVLEELGFKNVQSVISSGNVLFESDRTDTHTMETEIEVAWPEKLGFKSTTLIRSQKQLETVLSHHPYGNMTHGQSSYLLVTFFKRPTQVPFALPHQPEGKSYKLLAATKDHLYTVTDTTTLATTDLMVWLEKQFGKDISSRTLKTIERILKKMKAGV